MEKNTEWASGIRLDECDGEIYAAYTFVNGSQVYFRFPACDDEMEDAPLGNFTFFLGLYRGGITLADLGVAVLMYRALPFYYLEFGALSREIAEEPAVRKQYFYEMFCHHLAYFLECFVQTTTSETYLTVLKSYRSWV